MIRIAWVVNNRISFKLTFSIRDISNDYDLWITSVVSRGAPDDIISAAS